MAYRKVVPAITVALLISFFLVLSARAQTKRAKYPLTQFNNEGCMAKGGVQDCSGAVMRRILADGKEAIPALISQLTETARTKHQIADYWGDTRSGGVAFVVLTDLFTRPDTEASEMPDVPDWPTVSNGCRSSAQTCWYEYLRKHGRKSVQQEWLRAWNLHKDQIYWDTKAECFRLSQTENNAR